MDGWLYADVVSECMVCHRIYSLQIALGFSLLTSVLCMAPLTLRKVLVS